MPETFDFKWHWSVDFDACNYDSDKWCYQELTEEDIELIDNAVITNETENEDFIEKMLKKHFTYGN